MRKRSHWPSKIPGGKRKALIQLPKKVRKGVTTNTRKDDLLREIFPDNTSQ